MNKATYLESDTLKVEHVFTLNFNDKFLDKWDRSMKKLVYSMVDISFHFAESFRFIAVGIGAYFLLLGASKCIEASRSGGSSRGSSSSSSSSSSSKSSSNQGTSSRSTGAKDDVSVKSKSSSSKSKSTKSAFPKSEIFTT